MLSFLRSGFVLEANEAAERLLGCSREEILGMHYTQLHPPDKVKYYENRLNEDVQPGHVADFEAEIVKKNGSVVPAYISVSVVRVSSGRIVQWILRDITERMQTVEERRNLASQLLQSEKMFIECFGIPLVTGIQALPSPPYFFSG